MKGTVGTILKDNVSNMLLLGHVPVKKEIQFQHIVPRVKLWSKETEHFYTLLPIAFDEEDNVVEAVPYDIRLLD